MLKPRKNIIFSSSQHLQPLTVSMFWLDEPQHMLGLSEYKHTRTHVHNESGVTELVCASVFVYTRGRGKMFLAEAQSGIRRLSLPRTSLTLFCLFLAAVARVNHSTALLAIAEKLPRAAAQVLSAHYVNKTPCRLGGRGHTAIQLQANEGAKKERSSSYRLENYFLNVWRKIRQLPFFLGDRPKRNVQ